MSEFDGNLVVNVASGGNPNTDYFYAQDGLGTVQQIVDESQTTLCWLRRVFNTRKTSLQSQ